MDLLYCFKYNEKQKNDMQKKNEILSKGKLNGIKSKILKAIQFFFSFLEKFMHLSLRT